MADVKKLLDRVNKLASDKETLKKDLTATLADIKAQHQTVNEQIQACTRAASDAQDKVKQAVADLATSGVTAEAVANLEIARQNADKAGHTAKEADLRQQSAALEDPMNDVENAIRSIE